MLSVIVDLMEKRKRAAERRLERARSIDDGASKRHALFTSRHGDECTGLGFDEIRQRYLKDKEEHPEVYSGDHNL